MKRLLCIIVIATCLLSACANPLIEESAVQNKDIKNVITVIDQTEKPSVTLPVESEPQPTQTPKPTVIPTVMPTEKPEEQMTEDPTPTPIPTAKPTAEPTEVPTPQSTIIVPTPKPTATPTPEPTQNNEIISVSSAFINAAMAEINRQRVADGVAPAILSSSISSSCKNHAIAMAKSGEPFHASGVYMFEAVGRASRYMPGATMGSAAVAHVTQLKSDAVTKIGIGAVYYGDYVFYVIRGD